jgi:hypothetical protein
MGEVVCRRCGEEYTEYHISHILSPADQHAFRVGLYCPKCRTRGDPRPRDVRLMLESLAEIRQDLERKYLHLTLWFSAGQGDTLLVSPQHCYTLLEDYFIHCQIAEARIKEAWSKGILSYEEVQEYYCKIGAEVTSVIEFTKSVPLVADRMVKLTETQPFIPHLLKVFTRPEVYEAFVFLNRRYRTRAEPSDDRIALNKLH